MPEHDTGDYAAFCAVEHQLGILFRRAQALSARMRSKVHPELEPGAYGLLSSIDRNAPIRPSDLAACLGVGKATISRQVKVLEELGLVGREPDPLDRRAHRLVLTPQGRQLLDRVRTARQQQLYSLLSSWPTEDVWLLARMLERFNALTERALLAEPAPGQEHAEPDQARISPG
ncbi:transcriptional regulator [Thermobispora bispora]|jgi:DNA-binding MarR family transcriptional regulator|uniref:Transcriptional regulator, MarR family n=1 Tax=Thermobispora bispora (strain ATCC 19993 / DSM 43833 / CBS 139.67 / JCM 10125 / KCTC 9307 / NBRC 14880 / R51) TaxID=469371 RepID=D6Y3N2_THEBD|nr:MarR family transcriptional regulator [Thermobispora bispora]MBO2474391.1 MarR family transcriptional regulator [Actinomycetales bacterium]MDI9580843.1 MarR family transcriptional regulator [Thermobispora sp.]ADG87061.1 transcriptional regulator, MarR family [Thermobispora bispora DSM 43833]MBX6167605.1 MarR family transcriptional regulator [Thermobispora bispora]QSI47033.1 MarR family transcriptional regulator [Thermobispora bispora]